VLLQRCYPATCLNRLRKTTQYEPVQLDVKPRREFRSVIRYDDNGNILAETQRLRVEIKWDTKSKATDLWDVTCRIDKQIFGK
jgi:hypothetical protein